MADGVSPDPTSIRDAGVPVVRWRLRKRVAVLLLLALDTDRVFIDAPDPVLRRALFAAYRADGRDVVAAESGEVLLSFMEQLPVPRQATGDVSVVAHERRGHAGVDLVRELRARGWAAPDLVVLAPIASWARA